MADGADQEGKGGVKSGESNLFSNKFPKCSPHFKKPGKIHSYTEKRRRKRKTEVPRRE